MKKSISVVTLFPGASQCYAGQIRELFGDLVEVYSYSTSDQSVEKDNKNGFISGFYGCF